MSTDDGELSDTYCASCGIAAIDDIKLKSCNGGCDLVKYCSDKCQENHKEQHEEECLCDKKLFTQPDGSHMGECPICCLPLPIDASKSTAMTCCSKIICNGCLYVNSKRELEAGLGHRCAFCREPISESKEDHIKNVMERVKKNDPVAMRVMSGICIDEGDYDTGFQYLMNAAELGDADAHYGLSIMYREGEGVDKDGRKKVYHLEEAAIRGHPFARHNLGCLDAMSGRFERARKHFIIAANLGDDKSLKCVRQLYAEGHASKEEYASALRACQAADDATKSAEREEAKAFYSWVKAGDST